MSQVFRRYRDVDIVSTTNPGSTMADVITNVQTNLQTSDKYFQGVAGAVNGVNTIFTLADTPDAGTVLFYINGVLQNPGASNDYTISENVITTAEAPSTGSTLWVNYKVTVTI